MRIYKLKENKNLILKEYTCLDISCPDDNETISSTSTSASSSARCSPLWTVHHRSRACCPQPRSATTQQQCLDYCFVKSVCFAVQWSYDYYRCALHRHFWDPSWLAENVRFTTFVLNRQCNSTQGITICINCVSKKTSPTFLAITRESIIGFS